MKSKLLKIFLVCMLVVGVFVNNKTIIKAESDSTKGIVIRDGDKYIEYVFSQDRRSVVPKSTSTLNSNELNELGLSVGYLTINGTQYFALDLIKPEVTLHYPSDCSQGFKLIESEIPFIIRSNNQDNTRYKLTFTGSYEGETSDTSMNVTGIKCDGDLLFQNVNIDFFPELKGRSLRNDGDIFNNIVIEEHNELLDGYKTYSFSTDNVIINGFGTKAIQVAKDEVGEVENNGFIRIVNSKIEFNAVYPKPQRVDYGHNRIPIVELESSLYIHKDSTVTINANVPEKVENRSASGSARFIEAPILYTHSLNIDYSSSLTINDENYKYQSGIYAGCVEIEGGSLNIYGALAGIVYGNPDEDRFSEGYDGDGKIKINKPGFYFNEASVNITSYFVDILMNTRNPDPSKVPLSIRYSTGDKVSSTVRIMGTNEEREEYGIGNKFNVGLFSLTSQNQFRVYIGDQYIVSTSSDSSITQDPIYYPEFDPDDLQKYRAIHLETTMEEDKTLEINYCGKKVSYLNGDTKDTEISELDVDYDETSGYTINMLDSCKFVKEPNEEIDSFISCYGTNLCIQGGDKDLSFYINHSLEETKTNFVCVDVDSKYQTRFVGSNERTPLKIEIIEIGPLSIQSSGFLFISDRRRSKLDTKDESNISFDFVNINAKTGSTLFSLLDTSLTFNASQLHYGYVDSNQTNAKKSNFDVIKTVNLEIKNSIVELRGDTSLCDSEGVPTPTSSGIFVRDEVSIENCKNIIIKDFDCGIRISGDLEDGADGYFSLKHSSLDIECNKYGIKAYDCDFDLYSGDNLIITVSKVITHPNTGAYYNPAIYVNSSLYDENMIKVPKGSHISGVTYQGIPQDITDTTDLKYYKTVKVDTGDGPSDKLLIVSTHGADSLMVEPDDCPKDDPEENEIYKVYFDEDLDSFVVLLKDDLTFERQKDDTFISFIECRDVGFVLQGDKTLTFKYDLKDANEYYIGGWFRCFDIDENHDFIIEGLSNEDRMKIVVEETTSTDQPIDLDDAANSIIFKSNEPSKLLKKKGGSPVVSLTNVDIDANTYGQLFSLGAHDTEINNSNINFEFYPLNFKNKKQVIDKTCFQTINDIKIVDSNIEIIGNDLLNNFGDEDIISIQQNGAMISQGSITIQSTTGDHHIRIRDYLFCIGAFEDINIENTNLDAEGYRGGIGSARGSCSISLNSSDGYAKIKSDVTEHPVLSLVDPLKLPAVFGVNGVFVTGPSGVDVYAYDIDHNKSTFNPENMLDYVYVTIQEEKVPIPEPKNIREARPFKGPTSSEPGNLPYYKDENGYYYEDPEGEILIGDDIALQEWLKESSIPTLKFESSLVSINYEEEKYDSIDKIILPVSDSDNYVLLCDELDIKKEFEYLLVNGIKVSRDMYDLVDTDVLAIALKPAFINSLNANSNVTAYIVTKNGSSFSSFKIEKKNVDPPYNPPHNPSNGSSYKTPKTGIK